MLGGTGDVYKRQILDREGKSIVKYKYDGWGNHVVLDGNGAKLTAENCTATNKVGILNPFRYRSYYYDTETGLYFLKTRYYDPEVGRFITIDEDVYKRQGMKRSAANSQPRFPKRKRERK